MQRITPKAKLMDEILQENKGAFMIPKEGDIISAKVIARTPMGVFFDIGTFGTGIVYGKELRDSYRLIKDLEGGKETLVKIIDVNNEEGYVEISLKDAGEELTWDELKKKKEMGEVLELEIKNSNKGGLLAELSGIQAFLPVSQLSPAHYPRVEGGDKQKITQELRKFIGQKLSVKILDISPSERKIILSEKTAKAEDMSALLEKYPVGKVVEGLISGVVDFGAFIKFPVASRKETAPEEQLEGLIHISELDWQLISHPEDVIKVGDTVKAKIIDLGGGRISLSLKALKKDPWEGLEKKYKKGGVITAKATKYNPFGVFVEIEKNIQGLVHISEFGSEKRMRETIELGKEYSFKILLVEPEEHRMALALVKEAGEGKPEVTPSS